MPKKLPYIKFNVKLIFDKLAGASSIGVSIYDAKTGKSITTVQYPKYKDFGFFENEKYKISKLDGASGAHPAKSLFQNAGKYVKDAYDDATGTVEIKYEGDWETNSKTWFEEYLVSGGLYETTPAGDINFKQKKKLEFKQIPSEGEEGLSPKEEIFTGTHVYVSPVIDGNFVSMKAWKYDGNMILDIKAKTADGSPNSRVSALGNISTYGIFSDDLVNSGRSQANQDKKANLSKYSNLDTSNPESLAAFNGESIPESIPSGTNFIIGQPIFGPPQNGLSTVVVYDPDNQKGNDGKKLVVASCDLTPVSDMDHRPLMVDALPGSPSMKFPDWRDLEPCQPFKNESLPHGPEYWINVKTTYEDAIIDEMPDRIREATIAGIDRLLSFYNKSYWDPKKNIAAENQVKPSLWNLLIGVPIFVYSVEAQNAYEVGYAVPANIFGPTAIWETLSAEPTSQGHDWRSWHFDPGGVGDDGTSIGGQLSVLVRVPATYLEALPNSSKSFDYDRCGFTKSITFNAKEVMTDVEQAAAMMRSKNSQMKLSQTHTPRPYVDLAKEADRLENFVKQGLKGLLKVNGTSTGIIGSGGLESEEEYLIELGLDDEYSIKFAVLAEKNKLQIPKDKVSETKTIGTYKGAVPLLNGFQCFAEQFTPSTVAYFFYYHNMIGKNGAEKLTSNHWTDFVQAYTYPVPHIQRKSSFGFDFNAPSKVGEGLENTEQMPFFKDLAPNLRTREEAKREQLELQNPEKQTALKQFLAGLEEVGDFRSSVAIAEAFEKKAPQIYADSEYATEIGFVYEMVIHSIGVQALAGKLAHCMLLDMTLNEILEWLCRKALDEADYDTLREILLNSPWSAGIQSYINETAAAAGHAYALNEKLEQNAKTKLEQYGMQENNLHQAQSTYKTNPSPDNFKILCEQQELYKDILEQANIALGAQFFGNAPLAESGLKIAEYKEVLVNIIRNLPDYLCRDIIGKLASAIEFTAMLSDLDWEKVYDGLPPEFTFNFPKIYRGDLTAAINALLKEAVLKTIAMILIELVKWLLKKLIEWCMKIRSHFDDAEQKVDLGPLVQPDMVSKAMSLFGGENCKDISEGELISSMYELFNDMSLIFTTPEICALLNGTADPKLLEMIVNLINKRHQTLTGCLPNKDKVEDLLSMLGAMMDTGVCENLANQSTKLVETDGEYDGACPPEFADALACGNISAEMCDEQMENLKKDAQNSLAELAKLMDQDPDTPITMPSPMCGASSSPDSINVNYPVTINIHEFAGMSYVMKEILGTMFSPVRGCFNSDLANFLPAVTIFDSVYDSKKNKVGVALMDTKAFSNINNLDLEDPDSVEKLKKMEGVVKTNNLVAPSLKSSLMDRDNFKALANTTFQDLSGYGLPMLDDVPTANVLQLEAVTSYPLSAEEMAILDTTDGLLQGGMRMYCIYPRFALAGAKKDPYIIFISDTKGNLMFADVGDGDESLFKEMVFAYAKGSPLNSPWSQMGVQETASDPFEDVGKIIVDAKQKGVIEVLGKVAGNVLEGETTYPFEDMEGHLVGQASPQAIRFSDLLYDSWNDILFKEEFDILSNILGEENAYLDDGTEATLTKAKLAEMFNIEFNLANQYILRKMAEKIGTSELFNKKELQRLARALVLEVPCAEDSPDVKSSLLDLPAVLDSINEKMGRLACVPGALEDVANPPLKRASIEGVLQLLLRVIVIEIFLRGIFVLAKFEMKEIYRNVFFVQYVARQAMKEMDESFEPGVKHMFLRWVQRTIDDRIALNEQFINPFGPQEVVKDTVGNIVEQPITVKIETVQDAVGYLAMEQMKIVSDQLEIIIEDVFANRTPGSTTAKKQLLNMLRYGPPQYDSANKEVFIPDGITYTDIGFATYAQSSLVTGQFPDLDISGGNRFVKPTIIKIAGLTAEEEQQNLTTEQLKAHGIVQEQEFVGQSEDSYLEYGYIPGEKTVGTKYLPLGQELAEGGFILEKYIKHNATTLRFPGSGDPLPGPGSISAIPGSTVQIPVSLRGRTNAPKFLEWVAEQTANRESALLEIPYNMAVAADEPWEYGLRLSYVSPIGSSAIQAGGNLYDSIVDAAAPEIIPNEDSYLQTGDEPQYIGMMNLVASKALRYTEVTNEKIIDLSPNAPPQPIMEISSETGEQIHTKNAAGDYLYYENYFTQSEGSRKVKIYIHPIAEATTPILYSGNSLANFDDFKVYEGELFNKLCASPRYNILMKSINVSRMASMLGIYTIFASRNNEHMDKLFYNTKSSLKSLFRSLLIDDFKDAEQSSSKTPASSPSFGPPISFGGFPFNIMSMAAMTPFQIVRGLVELLDPGYLRYKSASKKSSQGPTGVFKPRQPPPESMGDFGKAMGTMTTITTPSSWYKYDSGNDKKDAYDFDFNIFGPLDGSTAFSFPWTPWGWLLTFVDFKWWDDLMDAFKDEDKKCLPGVQGLDPDEIVGEIEPISTNLIDFIENSDPLDPMAFGIQPCMQISGDKGIISCPEAGYDTDYSWPPSESIEFGSFEIDYEVDYGDSVTMVPETVELEVCHQLYILKRFYENFIPKIISLDQDGIALTQGMVFRLLEVMHTSDTMTCQQAIPQMAGGIGELYKQLTNAEILKFFKLKATDPMLLLSDDGKLLDGYGVMSYDSPTISGQYLPNSLKKFNKALAAKGYSKAERDQFVEEADISWYDILINQGADFEGYGEAPTPEPTLQELVAKSKELGLDLGLTGYPPEDNIVGLYALWRHYNAKCLDYAGENDYYGLLRGRGYVGGIVQVSKEWSQYNTKNYETFTLESEPYYTKAAYNSFWKEPNYNLSSDGIQNSIYQTVSLLSGQSLIFHEELSGPVKQKTLEEYSIKSIELIFVNDLGPDGTYMPPGEGALHKDLTSGGLSGNWKKKFIEGMWDEVSKGLGLKTKGGNTPNYQQFDVIIAQENAEEMWFQGDSNTELIAKQTKKALFENVIADALFQYGRSWTFEFARVDDILDFRNAIRRLWEIEERFKKLGFVTDLETYGNEIPSILQGENKVTNWSGPGKFENFLSKYFDSPVTGERDYKMLGRICGVLPIDPAIHGSTSKPWHKNVSDDNWIVEMYSTIIDEYLKASLQTDQTLIDALGEPNPDYPPGVYGPDVNGWFWEQNSETGEFHAWPPPGDLGYDPRQPAILGKMVQENYEFASGIAHGVGGLLDDSGTQGYL